MTRSEIFSVLATLISLLAATERAATRQLYAAVKYALVSTGGEATDVVNIGSAQMITAN